MNIFLLCIQILYADSLDISDELIIFRRETNADCRHGGGVGNFLSKVIDAFFSKLCIPWMSICV